MTMTSRRSYQSGLLLGNQEPCVRVSPAYNETDGLDAERILRSGNLILDPWQGLVLCDWMAINNGKWLCRTCGGSVPRQNGKTGLVEARAEAGMGWEGEIQSHHMALISPRHFCLYGLLPPLKKIFL